MFHRLQKAAGVSRAIAAAALGGCGRSAARPIYLDVGARGGLPVRWQLVYRAHLIQLALVEADAREAERLRSRYARSDVMSCGLGDIDGEERDLKITREPGRSSLLEPNMEVLRTFGSAPWEVVRRTPTKLRRLDHVWPGSLAPPMFVKIDVQGFELHVLRGFGDLLDHVVCVELEVALSPMYHGQPHLVEVADFMRARGFGLVRLASMGFYAEREMLEFNSFWVRVDHRNSGHIDLWKRVNGVGNARRAVIWGY